VRQLDHPALADSFGAILRETGADASRLLLEITESTLMADIDVKLRLLHRLAGMGLRVAIDDFGTGYSSLAYLKQMPVQTLKIDRSFIKDISTDSNDEAIAIAIIQLGKSLNLSVIAEGVETEEQANFLVRHGCNQAQGYLYSKPVMPSDLLARWQPTTVTI
jgi:EAL domain-containing protein (putative c-di-GMP-specific phosphodiesterase class I)